MVGIAGLPGTRRAYQSIQHEAASMCASGAKVWFKDHAVPRFDVFGSRELDAIFTLMTKLYPDVPFGYSVIARTPSAWLTEYGPYVCRFDG